jgi:hypothetical protein
MVAARNSSVLVLLRIIYMLPLIEKSFWTRDKLFSSTACVIGRGEELFPISSHE